MFGSWFDRFFHGEASARLQRSRRAATSVRPRFHPQVVRLEDRTVPSVTITNNAGLGYAGLDFNQSGGWLPPDTCGAAGPLSYVETINQTVAIYSPRTTGATEVADSFDDFFPKQGGLPRADSGSGFSDPIVVYDEQMKRFIVGDQDVDFGTHVSLFDIAVSKTSSPTTLTAADWNFYALNSTEQGYDADYPGNFGYNHDAFVVTLNMFGAAGHVQVISVNTADLVADVPAASLHYYNNDVAGQFSLRPTTMHDSVAGDPMWLLGEGGNGASINVIKMSNVLSTSATFTTTNLGVKQYSGTHPPLQPDGSVITGNIDSRILKAAEYNNTIVASHSVGVSPTQDDAQWYKIDVSTGTPALADQGRVSAGDNTYITYPVVDINSSGDIGMTYMQSGTDTASDYLSMWVTGRLSTDPAGTMQTPNVVPAGTGMAIQFSAGRAGDLSGINVDPVNHHDFWAASEFANDPNTEPVNYGTAIAQFNVAPVAKFVVAAPTGVTAGQAFTVTLTVTHLDGTPFPNYIGTVHFTSTDPLGLLPRDYKFTATDAGVHSFTVRLRTAGAQTITIQDTRDPTVNVTTPPILVVAAPASQFIITSQGNLPPGNPFSVNVQAGVPFDITVTATDPFGNVQPGYRGTVHFTSSDPKAVLPPNFTFVAANQGVAVFEVTLYREFTQTITAVDTLNTWEKGSISINVVGGQETAFVLTISHFVSAGVPLNLTVTAVDQYGNIVPGFDDQVIFTSSDSQAHLPPEYWFQPSDNGRHVFVGGVTFGSAGTQTLTATWADEPFPFNLFDEGDPPLPFSNTVTVKVSVKSLPPPPPPGTGETPPPGSSTVPLAQLTPALALPSLTTSLTSSMSSSPSTPSTGTSPLTNSSAGSGSALSGIPYGSNSSGTGTSSPTGTLDGATGGLIEVLSGDTGNAPFAWSLQTPLDATPITVPAKPK